VLTSIDRLIAEERKAIIKAYAIDSLAKAYYCLLDAVHNGIELEEATYEELSSVCLYCGAAGDSGLEYKEESRKNGICVQYYHFRSCGKRIEI
jgi:hypothetical protein